MSDGRAAAWGALLLRVVLGGTFVAHALLKILVFTLPGTARFFESLGLPGGLAYAVTAMELGGGIAMILGVYARWVALALIPVLLGAIFTVHGANGWLFDNKGGGWEFPAFWAAMQLVQFLLGDGAFALVQPRGARPSS